MTAIAEPPGPPDWTGAALHFSVMALVGAVWISSAIFGFYILAYYGGAIPASTLEDWNETLPKLYEAHTPAASTGMGAHFFAGAILLLLGPVQLIGEIRQKAPAVHRWIGRVYAFAALGAGMGGLVFIALKGTVGGPTMTVAFSLYGALMVLAAVQTVRHAMTRRLEVHRAWAIRLFALAIGSWLYRMGDGFWFLATGDLGHTDDFSCWFDYFMDFAIFVPPLIIAEMFIRARKSRATTASHVVTTGAMAGGALFIALATFFLPPMAGARR